LAAKAEIEWMAGHPFQAIQALNLALIPSLENEYELSPAMRAQMNNNMGILQWHLGELDEALTYFNQALRAYKLIHG
jgi:tetratricopeptide (TPR) repeat protein